MVNKFILIVYLILVSEGNIAWAGQLLSFDMLVNDAIENSYDLKAAKFDYLIKKNAATQSLLSRFPELSVNMNSVYSEQLKDKLSYFFSEDNAFSSDNQRYGNTVSIDLSYTLFDFGQLKNKHDLTLMDEKIAQTYQFEIIQKVKLQTLSIFSKAWSLSEQIKLLEDKFKIYDEMIENLKRTGRSGVSSELDLIVRQKKRLNIEQEMLSLNQQFMQALADLSFLTGKEYSPDDIEFVELDNDSNLFLEFDHTLQPEFLIKEQELEMKKKQLAVIKAEFFPKLDVKFNYKYYGSDADTYDKSLENIDDESYYAGLFTSVALFKTVKNYYSYQSGQQEIRKARILLARKQAELENTFRKYLNEYQSLNKSMVLDKKSLSLVDQNLNMLDRLEHEKLIDRDQTLEQRILLIDEKIKISQDIINKSSTIKRFEILAKGCI